MSARVHTSVLLLTRFVSVCVFTLRYVLIYLFLFAFSGV